MRRSSLTAEDLERANQIRDLFTRASRTTDTPPAVQAAMEDAVRGNHGLIQSHGPLIAAETLVEVAFLAGYAAGAAGLDLGA
ncbi:hypothetical protein ACG83_10620 [Frankia sp. R43]|uniref:hypothetical protein n=1 Tax=Frankia sp. R43 TaxID=269536 RepID=UPI0006CA5608|nr:hypothetical protein [Frankia sp. R43]KPM55725.1 hypothetical protein ACG83_10620 [Frankia sp. R43]